MIESIGPYEIIREIGRGGMGVVYLAHDSKLSRNVAIKALPPELAEDADRLARFRREAQLLAQLHHPNIASIFGLEESGASRALVMELVEGPTLADRLAQGRLSPDESISIARQIAVALEGAHERGIIHRDLKPQNIKAPPDGTVKVLDFGLAKAMEPASGAAQSAADISHSPTLTHSPTIVTPHGTQMGVILGTAAYMSPEQARGGAVDKRADIWAFGVVLFEMLSGEAMFAADTVSDTLAGVLKSEIDFSKLPDSTPPQVRRLLRRCLERNPKNRLHDIADARIVLDEVIAGDTIESEIAPIAHRKRSAAPWFIALATVAIAIAVLLAGQFTGAPLPRAQLTRTSVLMPISAKADLSAGHFALSRDGSAVVFLASDATGSRLFVRELGESEARPLAGTENAVFPFWSADSQHIAFFADAMLRRVPRGGGPVQTICPAKDGRGGDWNGEGTIVFAADFRNAPLLQVAASGGEPTPVTMLDVDRGEVSHRFPVFLPNGREFVFSVEPRSEAHRIQIKAGSLDEVSMGKPLLEATAAPRFAPPNHLVFLRDGALMAQSMNLAQLEMEGEAQLLQDRPSLLQVVTSTPVAHVAGNGAMLYAPVDPRLVDFLWLDRDGRRSDRLLRTEGNLRFPAVSHSGDRVVVARGTSFGDGAIWIYDLEHGEGSLVTPRNQNVYAAIWAHDDGQLAGLLNPGSGFVPVWIAPESGSIRNILEPALRWTNPTDMSTDGLILLYDDQTPGMKQNLGFLRLDSDAPERTNYLTTPAVEWGGRLSPDGEYIAYTSDATGSFEVYVDTFPTPSRALRINTGGAALQVEFRSDGAELFILAAEGDHTSLYSCSIDSGNGLEIGRPQKLFTLPVEWSGFAPSPDGERFLLLEPVGNRSPTLTLVSNWQAQLAQ